MKRPIAQTAAEVSAVQRVPAPPSRRGLRLVAAATLLALAGCASPEFATDRKRDAADIFTASLGAGIGAKARIGPVGTGLLMETTTAGLRGGDILTRKNYTNPGQPIPLNSDMQLGILGGEQFFGSRLVQRRNKAVAAAMIVGLNIPRFTDFSRGPIRKGSPRQSGSRRCSAWPYLFQAEMVAALGPSLRLGFNVAELVDFGLGWAGLDLFGDDIAGLPGSRPILRENMPAPPAKESAPVTGAEQAVPGP